MHRVPRLVALDQIKPHPRNARTHSRKQVRAIADSIETFGFTTPVLVDEGLMLLAGHGRLEAARLLGLAEVPAIELQGLSEAKKRALLLADNKLAEKAGWDRGRLALELPELASILIEEGLDIAITGFEPVEIDQIETDFEATASDPDDEVDPAWSRGPTADATKDCSKRGEIVLDPFAGSGTTVIAAEKTGRRARAIEYDPAYCDCIVRRFERMTGKVARLAATGESFEDVAEQRTPTFVPERAP